MTKKEKDKVKMKPKKKLVTCELCHFQRDDATVIAGKMTCSECARTAWDEAVK